MALVGPGFPVLMLSPGDAGHEAFGQLADDFVERGAEVIIAGDDQPGGLALPFLPGLHPALAPIAAASTPRRLPTSPGRA